MKSQEYGWAALVRVRNYRRLWPADMSTSWAFEMENLILGWFILVKTESVLMLTVFGSLLYLGTLIAPIFGMVGDKIGHRNLLCMMRLSYFILAFCLLVLSLTDKLDPLNILIIAGLIGLIRSSDLAIRGVLVTEIVPAKLLTSALSISRTTMDLARIAGALTGAGLFVKLGFSYAYIFVLFFYLVGLLLTYSINKDRFNRQEEAADEVRSENVSPLRTLIDGIQYVRTTPQLLAAMWVAFIVNLVAFPICLGLLPFIAKNIYLTDQTGLGYMAASFAFGALVGSLSLSIFGQKIRPARMMIVFSAIWCLLVMVLGLTANLTIGIVILFLAGLAQSLSLLPLAVLLMRTSEVHYRGLVMGVRMLAIYGLPVGLLLSGFLIERFGFNFTVMIYGSLGMFLILLVVVRWHVFVWRTDAIANST